MATEPVHTPRAIGDTEIAGYTAMLRLRFGQIAAIAASMTAGDLNRSPGADGSNSVYALAAHTAGNARAWILGIACGQDMRRDRPGEFASSGDAAALVALLERTLEDIAGGLASLPEGRLGAHIVPAAELWGASRPHEISVRDAILQVVGHASLHLGHIELTRDLLASGA